MSQLTEIYQRVDQRLTRWMADSGITFLRFSLGFVYFWFGVLKFFPGMSPADDLATRTIDMLSLGQVPASFSLPFLAVWECLIGIGLVTGFQLRIVLLLLGIQMLGTISPVLLFPQEVFARFPYALTLEGQYIIKNLIIISAAIVIGATVRGGKIIADPEVARAAKKQEDQKTSG